MNINNIIDMPEEVIMHIAQYLPYLDRASARLVCKYFYFNCTKNATITQEVFTIRDNYLDNNVISVLMNSNRNFTSFEFINVIFSQDLYCVFDKYGENILSLSLIDCDIEEKQFTDILSKCLKLKSLCLSSCKSLLMPGTLFSLNSPLLENKLPYLRELSLENCAYLNDDVFKKFIEISPNITSLSLKRNSICFHTALCKRFYKDDVHLSNPSNCVFTIFYIIHILSLLGNKLKTLNFSFTNIDNISLCKICSIQNLKLDKLFLSDCKQLSKFLPLGIGQLQPDIVELDLSKCTVVTNEVLFDICINMTKLKYLNIADCSDVTDEGLYCLKHLKCLKKLNISSCSSLSTDGLLEGLDDDVVLTHFWAESMIIEENNLLQIAPSFADLIHLDLSNCNTLSNVSLKIFFQHCKKIKYLVLSQCSNITDDGLIPCNFMYTTDSGMKTDENVCNDCSIDNLQGLCSLDMENCSSITGRSIEYAFNLPDMRKLNMNGTKVNTFSVSFLVQKCRRLTELNLNHCNIDDSAVIYIVKNLHHLKYLSFKNCNRLSDRSLAGILQYSQNLQKLDVMGCYQMTRSFLDRIRSMPTMRKLFCSDVLNENYRIPPAPPFTPD